ALLVEGVAAEIALEPILFEFAGEATVLTEPQLNRIFKAASTDIEKPQLLRVLRQFVLSHLTCSFLNVSAPTGRFSQSRCSGCL
ncbi:hypothetical protein, partial [Streptomyces albogriseolus]|uniref:hypothetical protein n=1 Tax=Streptomyces albogriseolus TaxID=1887 RepID=UPI00345F9528